MRLHRHLRFKTQVAEPTLEEFTYKRLSPFVEQWVLEDGSLLEPKHYVVDYRPREDFGEGEEGEGTTNSKRKKYILPQPRKTQAEIQSECEAMEREFSANKLRRKRMEDRNWIVVVRGADGNSTNRSEDSDDLGVTFFEAAKKGHQPLVMEIKMKLLKRDWHIHGGDITCYRDPWGRTPLHYAAMSGNEQAIDSLKEMTNALDEDGWTPLHTV